MSWVKDGQIMSGEYCGFPVTGKVTNSRVRYGGKVEYTLALIEPLKMPWRDEECYTVCIDVDLQS